MRLIEINEAVRMGKRDLSAKPKKDFTIGFEFEVLADGTNIDLGDLYSEFEEKWRRENPEYNFEKFFNTELSIDTVDDVEDKFDVTLEPIYGWASEYDYYQKVMIKYYAERFPEKIQTELRKLNKIINKLNNDYDSVSKEELINAYKGYYSIYEFRELYDDLPPNLKKNTDDSVPTNENNILNVIYHHANSSKFLSDIGKTLSTDTDTKTYYWMNDEKTKVGENIQELNDILNYFTVDGENVDSDYFEDLLNDDFNEWIDNMIREDFDEYLSNRNDKVHEVGTVLDDTVTQRVVIHDTYHQYRKNPNMWTVEPDGSIEGAEIVSPVFDDLDEAFENMNKIFEMIKYSFDTDSTTGLHVNIGTFSKEELANLDLLKFLILSGGDKILQDFDRIENTYAESNIKALLSYFRGDKLTSENYSSMITTINKYIITYAKKNRLFNFSKLQSNGYIEVRGFGNAGYENRGPEIENYIRKILRAIEISMDQNAYKETYIKYLYKLVGMANPPRFKENYERALNAYITEYNKITQSKLKIRAWDISNDMANSYDELIETLLNENEYDMILPSFLKKLSNVHSIMKEMDDSLYRKQLSEVIKKHRPIITEFRNLSMKNNKSSEDISRLELLEPIVAILKIITR
jgi:hypothetical protein